MADVVRYMPELEGEEMLYVQNLLVPMTDDQAATFAAAYRGQRRDPSTVMLLTLLGFIVIAGVQRFYVGQIGMGLLFLFTAGFCLIGTIVDLVNHKKLAFEYNRGKAHDIATMMNRRG